jgi:predicted dehydrogenase
MPLRYTAPVRQARAQLDALGDLRAVAGTNRGQYPGGWFGDPGAGGGATADHTVHVVDLVHWLTGEHVVEVHAELGSTFTDAPVEDVNVLSMELADGTAFTLDGSWSRPDEDAFWGDATLELVGTEDVVTVDCFDQTLRRVRDGGEDPGTDALYWGSDPDAGLVADFVDAVASGRTPETSGEAGLAAVRVVAAAYESDARGEPVATGLGAGEKSL